MLLKSLSLGIAFATFFSCASYGMQEIESPPNGRSQRDVTITEHLEVSTESPKFSEKIIKTLQHHDLIAKGNPKK